VARKKPRNHSAKAVEPENRRHRSLLWGGIVVVRASDFDYVSR
jgi:hypothetical protein